MPAAFTRAPASGVVADAMSFTMESAWWVCNLVSNYAYSRYAEIAPEVQAAVEKRRSLPLSSCCSFC